jgi:predicted nucleotidyltransferase
VHLSTPMSSVIPSAYAPVLSALVRTNMPLSGRQVAALVEDRVSRSRVNGVLNELAEAGLVLRESHPPSILYRFNRQHVAAEFVEGLANLRKVLFDRIRAEVAEWKQPAVAVWMFGSAARGDGTRQSDVDLFVVRPDPLDENDVLWNEQLMQLSARVRVWTGNSCEMLELSQSELAECVANEQRIAKDLGRDAIHLSGASPSSLLKQFRVAADD